MSNVKKGWLETTTFAHSNLMARAFTLRINEGRQSMPISQPATQAVSFSMRFARPCLECQRLHTDKGEFCADCRTKRERDRERQRSLDPKHRAKKRELYSSAYKATAKILKANATHCHICKKPFTSRAEITADHLIAGDPASPLAPAHKSCNSSRGNKPL